MTKVNLSMSGSNKHLPILLALLFAGSILLNLQLAKQNPFEPGQPRLLPSEGSIEKLHLGYANFLSAAYWMETISYYGEHVENSDFELLAQLLRIVTTLNPNAEHAYYMNAAVLPWNTGSISLADPLLARAIENFPHDWRWPYYRGFYYYWFENDKNTAAKYLSQAAEMQQSPAIIKNLALRMQSESNGLDTALLFLKNLLKKSDDKHMRRQLIAQMNAIHTEKVLRTLDVQLKKLPNRHYDHSDIEALEQMGLTIPRRLPDGGIVQFNEKRELVSSATNRRFKIFAPPQKKGMQK